MSLFAGLWAGFKCIGETVDSAATVVVDPERVQTLLPADFEMPEGGLNTRIIVAEFLLLEELLHRYKIPAALAYARTNRSEEHTSELQSLMRISYAVFCLKKKNNQQPQPINTPHTYYTSP